MANWWADYRVYLNSPRWQTRRRAALKRAGHRCEFRVLFWRCNQRRGLEVHHRTYKRVGDERPGDLMALCNWHHRLVTWFARVLRSITK